MNGTYFFPNGQSDHNEINEPGMYRYKIIKEINFAHRNENFSYKYDYIDLNIIPEKVNTYNKFDKVILIENKNTKNSLELLRNDEAIYKGYIDQFKPALLNPPGDYESKINIKYKMGGITKNIILNYQWNIEKKYKGDCKEAYICLLNDKIEGTLEEVISTFVVL